MRNLRSESFVTAGIATVVDGESSYPIGGGVFISPDGLNRGDSYRAQVYTPRPSERQLRENTDTFYEDWLRRYLTIYLPEPGVAPSVGPDRGARPAAARRLAVLGRGGHARGRALRRVRGPRRSASWRAATWRACGRSRSSSSASRRARSTTSSASSGGSTTASPTPSSRRGRPETLDGFVFDSKIGFCQQFSGAEALLLRMGGIPARVATGFTSGSFDEKQREFVVRDLDAHSWVEAWMPALRLGDARPDAGRRAAALPAR